MPDDSCIFQLFSIFREINLPIDWNPTIDLKGLFLDINKAFRKVRHEIVLFKLNLCVIAGELLDPMRVYVQERQQRVVLNGQSCSWKALKSSITQVSVLGRLLFLRYIYHSNNGHSSKFKTFADGTSLISFVDYKYVLLEELNSELKKDDWALHCKSKFNPSHV